MENLEKYFDSIGEKGSIERLTAISTSNLGLRSEAASRVCEKRYRRKELMQLGLSYEDAVLIVNRENEMKDNKHIQSFNEPQENLNISDVSGSNSKKSKFKINDIVEITNGDMKNKLFKVVDIDYSHKTLELIKCKSVEFDSNKTYNFDNLCADVVLREGEFDLDFLVKNFYLVKK